ncbi:DUF956 family protein [Lacticaseibacillus kribbianus]|uniref:DUF956 family protein n=1 Tax=Lacticaseibacillus kribbianus TaxID=2926292 RepID=UPI001CD5D5E2|nr:DUF956 family protein [Lacticaseibacillus kribbianus]
MVESLNTKVEIVVPGTSFMGMPAYGKVMVGDRGFEFYDDRNPKNYMQFPWKEIDHLAVSVMFGGKWLPRYAIVTRKSGTYTFSSHDPKAVLRAVRDHIPADRIRKSLTFWQVLKSGGKNLFHKESWINMFNSLKPRSRRR